MTDEPKKPMTATEFVERNRELKFAKGGRIHFPSPLGDEIIAALSGPHETIIPRGRLHRPAGTVTGRFSGKAIPQFVMQISVQDKVTPEFKRIRDVLQYQQYRVYYGERIAKLLTSRDRRQRKRGARLRDKKFSFGWNLSDTEARVMVQNFRESMEGAKLAAFWNTELGEPYDPERYRKD